VTISNCEAIAPFGDERSVATLTWLPSMRRFRAATRLSGVFLTLPPEAGCGLRT